MNCRSIKNKKDDLAFLLATTDADIVCGTESWLDPSMTNSEIFPPNYEVYRKDRNSRGGGVFLLVSKNLQSTALEFQDCVCESVWCKIKQQGYKFLTVGVFHRPPSNNSLNPLLCLSNVLSAITPDDVILSGDFNLPNIDWVDNLPLLRNSSSLYKTFKELVDTHELQQFVLLPTRYGATSKSILDLFLTNHPSAIRSVTTAPGISDHEAIITNVTCKHTVTDKPCPQKVYLFDRGDYDSLFFDLLAYLPEFECACTLLDIEELWNLFRNKLSSLITEYIPSRILSGRHRNDKPWMTKELRRLLNKKRRFFSKI